MADDADQQLLRCSRCHEFKPAVSFNWRRKASGQRETYCRPCRAEYKQEHYAANRQRYLDSSSQRRRVVREERAAYLHTFFTTHPCVDCGETDPRVLEFDHVRDKSFNVCSQFAGRPWAEVLAEINKCEVRCGNCHRRVTAERHGFYRARLSRGWGDLTDDPFE